MSIFTLVSGYGRKWFPSLWSGDATGVWESMDAQNNELFFELSQQAALRLSAVLACVQVRAETIGSLPLHVRESKTKKLATDHPIYSLLHDIPNAFMTSIDFGSMSTANVDLNGNHFSIIERRVRDGTPLAINPLPPSIMPDFRQDSRGRFIYHINGVDYSPQDVLHIRGFSMDGFNGMSRLEVGRNVLAAQWQADTTTMRAFRQGLKVGGFFELDKSLQNLDENQFSQFMARMARFNDPENQSKWMPLPPGFKPSSAQGMRISPMDAELLQSRHFGIEEICRLFNVPPPIIGHTSKASSWASSAEQLNLHFLMYSLQPTLIRREKAYWHKLLTPADRARFEVKYSVEGLLRADVKTRQAFYASGLQNGYLSQNEVRDMEDRPGIGEEGDVYRVQLNMAGADESGDGEPKKPVATEEDDK